MRRGRSRRRRRMTRRRRRRRRVVSVTEFVTKLTQGKQHVAFVVVQASMGISCVFVCFIA